ncbi:hypothetical protein [Aromatoleum bremense]|uniref:Uncharacterized protein n=1 Tax=Aromatoleum bremense TaxID=76115 RepID=A0ABX1NXV7_9RHOO|nr:hypothetical protein [Aromatoleum bremense]NMG16688.1 hypothetical protein [Aromatoleum bremense]
MSAATMRDREFVNRFCAFQLQPLDEYRGDMDEFLARALKKMNGLTPGEIDKLSAHFRSGLINNYKVFDRHAFRKHLPGQESRSVLNASLWDVMTTGLARYPEHVVEARADELRNEFYPLMKDDEFVRSVTYGPNDVKKVKHRFNVTGAVFRKVFDA